MTSTFTDPPNTTILHNSQGLPSEPHTNASSKTDIPQDETSKAHDVEKGEKEDIKPAPSIASSEHDSEDRTRITLVNFSANDTGDPQNWSPVRKIYIVFVGILLVFNSTYGSSIAAGSSQRTADYFNVTSTEQLVLPTSMFLVGYVIGPLISAPLSESYGRKPVMFVTFLIYTAFALGSALAPTWAALIVMRTLCGMGAGTPISVVGGIYADIYRTPRARGTAVMIFMTITVLGPLIGPATSGFISIVSWRWSYWLQLILAAVSWPFFLLMPETYRPILLKQKAIKLRKETGDEAIKAKVELESYSFNELVTVVLTRPFRMLFFEAIVLSACIYMALLYAVFYMFLQAYPIIFEGVYGFNAGEEGLTFLAIAVGAAMACGVYLYWDWYLEKRKAESPAPVWTKKEEYRRVPLACFAGPFLVIGIFWLGWTARSNVHWIVPVLAGIPFGLAYLLVFMGLINYIVDAYEAFSASALAAGSCSRSLFGVVLPFAVPSMFNQLGIAWACSLLGFVSLAMAIIPFVFIRYGEKIRANSEFCQQLKRQKEEQGNAA